MREVLIFIKKNNGHNMISIDEFKSMKSAEKVELILDKKLEFRNSSGELIPTKIAIKQINQNGS